MQTGSRLQITVAVAANVHLCEEHYRLTLRAASFPPSRPGQFVQLACQSLVAEEPEEWQWDRVSRLELTGKELLSPLTLLRRPFSLAGRRETAEGAELDIIYRAVGTATRWLAKLKPGQTVSVIGPLGNGFEPPRPDQPAILVGGGVGIPPMLYLAEELKSRAVAFCGVMQRDLLPLTITADSPEPGPQSIEPLYNIAEFASCGVPAVISTDDGSYGFKGYITDALERYLNKYFTNASVRPVIYTCGPEVMMKRVAALALEREFDCQVAVERNMACGMGTCQSCVIRVRQPADPKGWVYKLACTDGPIFQARELLW